MYKLFTILFLWVCVIIQIPQSIAGNTIVQGVAENVGQREIKLFGYHDYLSMKPQLIASTKTNKNGKFKLDIFLSQTEYLRISVGFKESSFFISPGSTMNVHIDYGEKVTKQGGTYPLQKPLDILIKNESDTSVNREIFKFDSISGRILSENEMLMILYQHDFKRYDSLKKKINLLMGDVHSSYVKNYIRYRYAQLETVIYPYNLSNIGEHLLADQEILYRHSEYMNFFENYVNLYVPGKSEDITLKDIEKGLNQERPDYRILDETLGKDTIFRNEKVREIASVLLLKSSFYNRNYDPDKILKLLDGLIQHTKFEKHKKIAAQVKYQLQQHKQKNRIKDFAFSFPGNRKDSVRFSDFKGRYLLIAFYQHNCMDCILEMDIMQKLYEEHSNEIFLLGIFLDEDYTDFKYFIEDARYEWNMVHFDYQYDLIRYFNLRTIPRYILVAPDGKIKRDYFPKLGTGGLKKINQLLKQF